MGANGLIEHLCYYVIATTRPDSRVVSKIPARVASQFEI